MRLNPWRPRNFAWIVVLAIVAGVIVAAMVGAGESDTGLYQFACLHYHDCIRQYAFTHVEIGAGPILLAITVSVIVVYAVLWVACRGSDPSCDLPFGGGADIGKAIADGMTTLPYAEDSQEYPLFRLEPRKDFSAQVDKAMASRPKSAALLLVAGREYLPCEFLLACERLKREFGDNFRHLYVASAESGYIVAVAAMDAGYPLALAEGHYYAVKFFLGLVASSANLAAALALRDFAVEREKADGSSKGLLSSLQKSQGSQLLVCDDAGRPIGMISFAKIAGLLLRHCPP